MAASLADRSEVPDRGRKGKRGVEKKNPPRGKNERGASRHHKGRHRVSKRK